MCKPCLPTQWTQNGMGFQGSWVLEIICRYLSLLFLSSVLKYTTVPFQSIQKSYDFFAFSINLKKLDKLRKINKSGVTKKSALCVPAELIKMVLYPHPLTFCLTKMLAVLY